MVASIGSTVHPWYKGNHEWRIKGIADLEQSVKYQDRQQGDVSYDPKIMLLEGNGGCTALWFNYWIATKKTGGKMKWGGGPPVLEELVLLELIKKGIKNGLFSEQFITVLAHVSQTKPYEFKNEADIVHQLSDEKAHTDKWFEKRMTDVEEIVDESVQANTFRAFGHMREQPSKVFRNWAKAEFQNQNNIDELLSINNQPQYDEWLRKFSDRFSDAWQKQMGGTIPFGSRRKLPNLLLKKFVLWDKLSRVQRDHLLNYLHIPLDSYTLVGMRNCVGNLKIRKNATMKFVEDEVMYNQIQRAVRDIAYKAEVPAIYFDNLAWDKSHGKY